MTYDDIKIGMLVRIEFTGEVRIAIGKHTLHRQITWIRLLTNKIIVGDTQSYALEHAQDANFFDYIEVINAPPLAAT